MGAVGGGALRLQSPEWEGWGGRDPDDPQPLTQVKATPGSQLDVGF